MLKRTGTMLLTAALLAGCATIPEVTFNYYPVKWEATTTVTQTVDCDTSKTHFFISNAASTTPKYSSNFEVEPYTIKIRKIEGLFGTFADSEITMTLTEDGRLRGINQSTTGQGEAVIKSAVTLAATVLPIAALKQQAIPAPGECQAEGCCEVIKKWGDGKPVTLTYKVKIDGSTDHDQPVYLQPAAESEDLHERLQNILPKLEATISKEVAENKSGPIYPAYPKWTWTEAGQEPPDDMVYVRLQKAEFLTVTTTWLKWDTQETDVIATDHIVVNSSDTYPIPIPKAKMFGKQSFGLSLSEAGAVTSITYGKNTGAAGALNSIGAIANAETPASKAAALREQADLIYQQQRLVLCRAKPDKCTAQ